MYYPGTALSIKMTNLPRLNSAQNCKQSSQNQYYRFINVFAFDIFNRGVAAKESTFYEIWNLIFKSDALMEVYNSSERGLGNLFSISQEAFASQKITLIVIVKQLFCWIKCYIEKWWQMDFITSMTQEKGHQDNNL